MRQWPVALDVLERFTHGEVWSEARQVLADSRTSWVRANVPDDEVMAELTGEGEFIRNNMPDFWWIHLYLLGVSPVVAFGLPLILVGIGSFAAFQVIRVAAERGEIMDECVRKNNTFSATG